MANPTTNYGFVLPTPTDLVTDLPADFDVALQGVDTRLKALQPGTTLGDLAYSSATANTNTRLPIGTNGQVLGVVAGVPAWTTDASGMTNPMTTTGDTIYSSSGSTPARLGIGTTGQVLTVAGGIPSWATASSGGMTSIASGSLSTTSLNLTSISGSYNDLRLVMRGVSMSANATLSMQVNGTASIYDSIVAGNSASTLASTNYTMTGGGQFLNTATNGEVILNFYDYANTAGMKYIDNQYVYQQAANYFFGLTVGAARLTSAINQITITSSQAFDAGTYVLYGIK